ncbi:MAG: aminoacetone oxidase family FAD-binding enzyme [Clostridia bacterium]|nr:aminoacetone oxidase family FAD-binding enzyme [Clostridia bacterium]
MNRIYKVAIIGGGASGLVAGAMLSQYFADDVVILERTDRVGKKITATGNGRGNVTNERVSADNYHSVEGDAQAFVRPTLRAFGKGDVKDFLASIGMITVTEKGRVYPASLQASSVLDLLRLRIDVNRAEIRTGFYVTDIKAGKFFEIRSEKGETVYAASVILAAGGKCQKQFGTDGSGYRLAKQLGHTFTECHPSLVQLKTDMAEIKPLKGIRQEVLLTLLDGDMLKTCEKGDLLFTEFGVSGNAVFQVSGYAASARHPILSVEFLPEFTDFELAAALTKKIASAPYLKAEDLLTGYVNKQVGRVIVRSAGINLNEKCDKSHIKAVVRVLKDFRLTVLGSLGFNYAQVTRGGVRLSECDAKTLQSKKAHGLYLTGEVLDIDGDCGGYNLQWAFSSAFVAAREIARVYGVEIEKIGKESK